MVRKTSDLCACDAKASRHGSWTNLRQPKPLIGSWSTSCADLRYHLGSAGSSSPSLPPMAATATHPTTDGWCRMTRPATLIVADRGGVGVGRRYYCYEGHWRDRLADPTERRNGAPPRRGSRGERVYLSCTLHTRPQSPARDQTKSPN